MPANYVPNIELQYMGNCSAAQFANVGNFKEDGFHEIAKLPKEVSQAMLKELESYDLDIGDWFTFSCGKVEYTPKEIRVVLRISEINTNGTYTYNFYAWQRY